MANPSPIPAAQDHLPQRWQVPRLRRDGRILGGVAAGIADEVGVDPVWLRAAFVVLTTAGGLGALAYGAAWLSLSIWEQRHPGPAATPQPKAANPANRVIGVCLITVGLAGFWRHASFGLPDRVAWPVALAGTGALLAWHRGRPERTDRLDRLDPLEGTDRPERDDRNERASASRNDRITGNDRAELRGALAGSAPLIRIVAGLSLAAAGIAGFALLNVDLNAAGDVVVVTLAIVAGIALLIAPWASAMLADLGEERRRRIRSEERARMAAHLHDSVLQTLALIQRSSGDPARMTSLARRQERELRSWLYGAAESGGRTGLRASLEGIAVSVEQLHGVAVEVVAVGDAEVTDPIAELLAAAREAIVNAAKHSGGNRVDVFAEVRADVVEVFVRDTGKGFDIALVPTDRAGLSRSIRARMARAGGEARIESAPGEGTEVELRLRRER